MVEQSEPAAGQPIGRRVGEPANPLPSGKEQCGAALRGHACDGISRIRFPVPQRSREESGTYNDSVGCEAK